MERGNKVLVSRLKQQWQIILLTVVFVFALKFFQSTPFERLFFQLQAGFLGLILLFLVGYVVSALMKRKKFNKVVLYYLLLIAIIPFYGAYRAGAEFGQPFIYGFLSERGWLLFGVGVWLYYLLVTKKMTFETMESAFVFMAWASLIIFSFFVLTFDPSQLQGSEELSKFAHMTEDRGLRFKFQRYFITFGAIYYFVRYSVRKNPIDFIFLLLFLGYILLVIQGRFYMIGIATTFLLYYWLNFSVSRFVLTMIKILLFILVMFTVIQAIMPDYLERMGYLFAQMFTVLTGEESQDSSANARIFASLIVLDYFDVHPLSVWLGTGSVSHQWNDGYDSIFGYFYPGDIGILGGLFIYGIIGFIFIFLIPLVISVKIIRQVSEKQNIFIIALKYLFINGLIESLQGSFYFVFISYIIPLFILLAYLKMQARKNVDLSNTNNFGNQ